MKRYQLFSVAICGLLSLFAQDVAYGMSSGIHGVENAAVDPDVFTEEAASAEASVGETEEAGQSTNEAQKPKKKRKGERQSIVDSYKRKRRSGSRSRSRTPTPLTQHDEERKEAQEEKPALAAVLEEESDHDNDPGHEGPESDGEGDEKDISGEGDEAEGDENEGDEDEAQRLLHEELHGTEVGGLKEFIEASKKENDGKQCLCAACPDCIQRAAATVKPKDLEVAAKKGSEPAAAALIVQAVQTQPGFKDKLMKFLTNPFSRSLRHAGEVAGIGYYSGMLVLCKDMLLCFDPTTQCLMLAGSVGVVLTDMGWSLYDLWNYAKQCPIKIEPGCSSYCKGCIDCLSGLNFNCCKSCKKPKDGCCKKISMRVDLDAYDKAREGQPK